MSSKVDHYRVRAEECCLNAVRAENYSRRIHWLEAAARWVALGRQDGAVLTTSNSTAAIPAPVNTLRDVNRSDRVSDMRCTMSRASARSNSEPLASSTPSVHEVVQTILGECLAQR